MRPGAYSVYSGIVTRILINAGRAAMIQPNRKLMLKSTIQRINSSEKLKKIKLIKDAQLQQFVLTKVSL
jgi:hypothetical protein